MKTVVSKEFTRTGTRVLLLMNNTNGHLSWSSQRTVSAINLNTNSLTVIASHTCVLSTTHTLRSTLERLYGDQLIRTVQDTDKEERMAWEAVGWAY
jgi:hypothetical protein